MDKRDVRALSSLSMLAVALAALLALTACDRAGDPVRPITGSSDVSRRDSGVASNDVARVPGGATAEAATSDAGTPGPSPGSVVERQPTAAGISGAAEPALSAADRKFIAEAAEEGLFEVAVATLAADRAEDSAIKAFAAMLADHHGSVNDRLRSIAQNRSVPLPASLTPAKQQELDRLSSASGSDFDRQFIQTVGIRDHKNDIALFEKASQTTQDPDVRSFVQSTLLTLKEHLTQAQKLPVPHG